MAQGHESSGSNWIDGRDVPAAEAAGAQLADARESMSQRPSGRLNPTESASLPSSHEDRAGGPALAGEMTMNGRRSAIMGGRPVGIWPRRPENEVFPELLDTILVAQLLLYDRRGMTPEQARRNVRKLVKEGALPTLGRIGSTLIYRKAAVVEWLANRNRTIDDDDANRTIGGT